jgi:hypothetical protein
LIYGLLIIYEDYFRASPALRLTRFAVAFLDAEHAGLSAPFRRRTTAAGLSAVPALLAREVPAAGKGVVSNPCQEITGKKKRKKRYALLTFGADGILPGEAGVGPNEDGPVLEGTRT